MSGIGGMADFLQALMAGADRKKILSNMHGGKLAQVRSGQTMVSGKSPYGYRRVTTPKSAHRQRTERLEIDPAEAKVVTKIFRWYVEGMTIAGIVHRLSDAGTPARSDTQPGYPVRKSKRWSRSTIHGILRNEAYTGKWRFNKRQEIRPKIKGEGKIVITNRPESEHIIVNIPAIIDVATFEKAQERLDLNKHNTRPPTRTYLLRSFCRCSVCGRRMVGRPKRKHAAYVCSHNTTVFGSERCVSPQFGTETIDEIVWGWVRGILTDPLKIGQFSAENPPADRSDEAADIRGRVGQLQSTRANWERMLATGRTTDGRFDAEVADIDNQIIVLSAALAEIERELGASSKAAQMMQTVGSLASRRKGKLERVTDEAKRKFIEVMGLSFVLARNDTHYLITASAPWLKGYVIEAKRA